MKRLLSTKTVAVGIISVLALLLVGVALASTNNSGSAQTAGESPTIILEQPIVGVGKPAITIHGSGYAPYEIALVELVLPGGAKPIIIGGKMVTDAETWTVSIAKDKLSSDLKAGVYTIRATGTGGSLATTPLVVVQK